MLLPETPVITAGELLSHWQGHRSLTRRVIEAFPDRALFEYSIGGMRSFAELAMEMIRLANSGIQGLARNDWTTEVPQPTTKIALLSQWDDTTDKINALWSQLPSDALQRIVAAFGQWEGSGQAHVFYWMDNEIHHRGQGYVYLRSLGIEPPPFYLRS